MTQRKIRKNLLAVSCVLVSCVSSLYGCAVVPRNAMVTPSAIPKNTGTYRGIVHVHSDFSTGNSKITLPWAVETAEKAGYDFVVITDHNAVSKGHAAYRSSNLPKYPLLIFGNEITTVDGHLLALGVHKEPPSWNSTQELVDWIHGQGGYAFAAHPFSDRTPWTNWEVKGLDGLEIYNLGHAAYNMSRFKTTLKGLFYTPRGFLKSVNQVPRENFKRWDESLARYPMAGIGACDAHIKLKWAGISFESLMLYYQGVSLYVYADQLDENAIVPALAQGRSYLAFESRGNAAGFSFKAFSEGKSYIPGDSIAGSSRVRFSIEVPVISEIKLIRDGTEISKANAKTMIYEVPEKGVFRVEVYRGGKLWIISNPIYIR